MSDPLATYLQDHLAGAELAIDMLHALHEQHGETPLGRFAADLVEDIETDRATLKDIADRVGDGSSTLKEATAWVGEKLSRLKLHARLSGALGTFETLETLGLGILGKQALWRALAEVAASDARLRGVDFGELAERARAQHARVETWRIEAARTALRAAA
jgi:hypothetical protein